MADAAQTRVTAADFFAMPETQTPTQLIEGEIVVSPSPKDPHQFAVTMLTSLLVSLTRTMKDSSVRVSPSDVYLDDDNVFQPDIFWVSGSDSLCTLDNETQYWRGAPDLVVDVLSPRTQRYDKVDKFRLYQKYGTREYWLVEPEAQYIEVYQCDDAGRFQLAGIFKSDEAFASAILDQRIELKQIFD